MTEQTAITLNTWSEAMRYVNSIFCLVLALFAILQYDDPDALLWFLIYGVPAAWCGAVAFRPSLLPANLPVIAAFLACLAAAIAGTVYMWPSLPANWIHVEEEREALGLMIATAGLVAAGWTWWRRNRNLSPSDAVMR